MCGKVFKKTLMAMFCFQGIPTLAQSNFFDKSFTTPTIKVEFDALTFLHIQRIYRSNYWSLDIKVDNAIALIKLGL